MDSNQILFFFGRCTISSNKKTWQQNHGQKVTSSKNGPTLKGSFIFQPSIFRGYVNFATGLPLIHLAALQRQEMERHQLQPVA